MTKLNTIVTIVILMVGAQYLYGGLPSTRITFENGLEAIFVENHSSPMITSVVFVNAGARYENQYNNGSTHFLEHLLFNGTRERSQEQLDDLIERHGGYINAFTRKDLTGYLVLMPKEYIDYGLQVQSDQLFNSILPEQKFDKERKIVIEEIRQSDDIPEDIVERFNDAELYKGTPYARPVLGYEHLIATVPREEIVKYYETYYAPNNMVALIIGDFETKEFIERYKGYFGTTPPKAVPTVPEFNVAIPSEKKVVRQEMKLESSFLNVSSRAPLHSDPDYHAFYILDRLLSNDATSPLIKALKGAEPKLQSVGSSITTQKDFSIFTVSVKGAADAVLDDVLQNLNQTMEQVIAKWEPMQADIDGIVVSEKTNEIYMREKLHYYGFMVAPLMVATGYDFVDNLVANLSKVKAADVKRVASKYFAPYNYLATMAIPAKEQETTGDNQKFDSYLSRTMPNGLEVIIKSNEYSEVQAFMVLGKDRTASEPEGRDGITDFVNRLLDKGTAKYPREQLSRELSAIGANLTVADNPYIPYDDRYTSRQFSFVKFETISDFTDQGIELLAEMIKNPTFPDDEIEQVRQELMGVLGMRSGSTSETARDLYFKLLFNGSSFSRTINGTRASVAAITRADLVDHHRKFYAPNNMILAICTDLDPEVMYQKIERAFGEMKPQELAKSAVAQPEQVNGEMSENIPMEKKQAYIYLGGKVCSASDPDAAALAVAVDILSARLGANLREKQGLAYRVGAGVSFDREFGWLAASMGTGVENYAKAKTGMLREMDSMKTTSVTPEELEKAVNSIWGSLLTSRLSRINQAYYMAVSQFIGRPYNYEDEYIKSLKQVTVDDIKRVADKYFDTKNYILATVGAPQS